MRVKEADIDVNEDMDDIELEVYNNDPEQLNLDHLDDKSQKELGEVIRKHIDVFAVDSESLGKSQRSSMLLQ